MCFRKKGLDEYKTIDSIKQKLVPISYELRQNINICIIDDKKYKCDGLVKLGYTSIDIDDKARNIDEYSNYHIILCDISGIASDISNKEEGLALAKELQKVYPFTEIFLFTGQNVQNYGKADGIPLIKKPKTNSELSTYFDECLKKFVNPQYLWNKLFKYLIANNVGAKDLVVIEDNFVRAYSQGIQFKMPNIPSIENKDSLASIARFIGVFAASYTKEICNP